MRARSGEKRGGAILGAARAASRHGGVGTMRTRSSTFTERVARAASVPSGPRAAPLPPPFGSGRKSLNSEFFFEYKRSYKQMRRMRQFAGICTRSVSM